METTRPGRSIPAWVVLTVLTIFVVLVTAIWWTNERQDSELDRNVERLEEILCPPSDHC